MSELPRKSPKLSIDGASDPMQVRAAIETLEDRPRVPEGAPASGSAPGFAGQIEADDDYLYVRTRGGAWKRVALSAF